MSVEVGLLQNGVFNAYEGKDIFVETQDILIQTDTVRKGSIYLTVNTVTSINEPTMVQIDYEIERHYINPAAINSPPFFESALPPQINVTVTSSTINLKLPNILDSLNHTYTVDVKSPTLEVSYDNESNSITIHQAGAAEDGDHEIKITLVDQLGAEESTKLSV